MTDITERLDEMHAAVVGMLPDGLMDLTDIDAGRATLGALIDAMPSPEMPTDVTISDHHVPGTNGDPDVLVRVYNPAGPTDRPAMYWIHGGGMVLLSVDSDDAHCATWASQLSVPIASVDYRLAPESPYPGPIHDCHAGLQWFATQGEQFGFDASKIVIGGASAGGGLAAGTALYARDHGGPALAGQLLEYPMLDDRNNSPSAQAIVDLRVWNRHANEAGWTAYLGDLHGSADVPIYAAPARASAAQLHGLPPTFINVGAHDMFLDEDMAYARNLVEAGVDVDFRLYPKAFHGSASFVADHPESVRWQTEMAEAAARLLGV